MWRYLIVGANAGLVSWIAFPILLSMPSFALSVWGDESLRQTADQLDTALEPAYKVWRIPTEIAHTAINRIDPPVRWVHAWVASVINFGLPMLAGALMGLAAFGIVRLIRRLGGRHSPDRPATHGPDPSDLPRPVGD